MKFTVQKPDLLRELQLIQGVVEKKATIPILANLLLEATKEGLRIVATDMELGIETRCEAAVEKPGAVTVHARKLHEIVRALPDAEIAFTLKEANRIQIKCAKSEFKVAGQDIEGYPPLVEYDFKGSVGLPLARLRAMVERVIFAVTKDDPRYSIYGALLIVRRGNLEMVATDGHRLGCVQIEADVAPKEEIQAIVPFKTLSEIVKLEGGPEGQVRIGLHDNRIFIRSGARTLQSSLLEGSFPVYEKVIPVGNDRIVQCSAVALLAAMQRVSLLSTEKTKGVKMRIEEESVQLSTSNPEFGEAEESLTSEGWHGDPLEVAFNARYITEFLQVLGDVIVSVELKDDQTQVLMRPADGGEMTYRYVVMPMRTS